MKFAQAATGVELQTTTETPQALKHHNDSHKQEEIFCADNVAALGLLLLASDERTNISMFFAEE